MTGPSDSAMSVIPNPLWDARGGGEERRCLDFFLKRTAIQLSGFWGSGFWDCLIIRATHHEPAIRHAVLALGSLHERFEAGDRSVLNPVWDKTEGGFALKQYNQAIQHLIKPTGEGQRAIDVCLIACMLFACFEVSRPIRLYISQTRDVSGQGSVTVKYWLTIPKTLRGHHGFALSHIKSGVKILTEVEHNEGGEQHHGILMSSQYPFVDFRELEILFNRLDYQVVQVCPRPLPLIPSLRVHCWPSLQDRVPLLTPLQMVGTPPMLLKTRPRDMEKGFCPKIPTIFVSLEQARNSLDYQWNSCIQFFNQVEGGWDATNAKTGGSISHGPLDVVETPEMVRQKMFNTVQRWLVAFRAFMQSHGKSLDSRGLRAARSLEISYCFATTYLDVSIVQRGHDETIWDPFTERFEQVVDLATSILESSSSDKSTQKRGADFSLDMHTVAPLYAVAHRCRHPMIRRKAVSLLYAAPRQEGIWDSVLTARVAERLIGIEESGLGNVTCCEDVPDWARVSDVEVQFDSHERHGTVTFSRQRSPLEKVRDRVMDSFRW